MSIRDFDSIQIKLASPEKILEWSYSEITKAPAIHIPIMAITSSRRAKASHFEWTKARS